MKKKLLSCMLIATCLLSLVACSKKDSNNAAAGKEIKTDYGTVKLGDYKGLEATVVSYEITEADIDAEVSNLLYYYTNYNKVSTPAKDGDYVNVYLTAIDTDGNVIYDYSKDSNDNDGEPYSIYLGSEEFGKDVDTNLTGLKTGDSKEFTVTYEEDFEDELLAGYTVTYNVTVDSVEEESIPELTDEFITDVLGYESEEAFRDDLKAELEDKYNSDGEDDAKEDLISQIIENSTFISYDEDKVTENYNSLKGNYESYLEVLGFSDLDELLDYYGLSEDSLKEDALNQTYRIIVVKAIASVENLEITDDEYKAAVSEYMDSEGYASEDDLIDDYGEETLRYYILEDKVLNFIFDNAKISSKSEKVSVDEIETESAEEVISTEE